MSKVKLEHELLDSKMATAVSLFNEWLKWCEKNGINGSLRTQIPKLFLVNDDLK